MAITTYSELKTAIANYLNRSDLTATIPDFISLAEAKINRKLRISAMEKRVRSTTASGDTYVALPSDFNEAIRVTIIASPNRDLDYSAPSELQRAYLSSVTGKPVIYTIEGDELRVAPTTDAAYTIELVYYSRMAALSDSNTTNWFTSYAPDLLLYMSMAEAEAYLKNDDRAASWYALADSLMEDIKSEDRKKMISGPLVMRVM